ncbi:MAG: hypothetical protein M5U09_30285 [Gammaproteobacteria bacterium]|nr:hypothetical protein [Gammaproteobacteria bacterium]
MSMRRDHALAALARHYPDGIVVAVYQSAFDWLAIRPHPLNYLGTGAMGRHPPMPSALPWAAPANAWWCSTATAACS